MINEPTEKRSESRTIIDQYHSVEFSIRDILYVYQFKIWDICSKGICVIVKEDSDVLKHIKVGDILALKYYKTDSPSQSEFIKTEIRHITKNEQERFKGHYFVGLSILSNKTITD